MYIGSGGAYFKVVAASDPSTILAEITLVNYLTDRKNDTLVNLVERSFTNPFTQKVTDKFLGYRIIEKLQVCSKNFRGTVEDYNNVEVVEETQTEFYKAMRLMRYSASDDYLIYYASHEDALTLLSMPLYEVKVRCTAMDSSGTVMSLGSNKYNMNIDKITIEVMSRELNTYPFLPNPPAPPVVVSPADLAVLMPITTFEWEEYPGGCDYYQLQVTDTWVSGEPVWTDLIIDKSDISGAATSYESGTNLDYLNGSPIAWHLRAKRGDSWSGYSAYRTNTVHYLCAVFDGVGTGGTRLHRGESSYATNTLLDGKTKYDLIAIINPTANGTNSNGFHVCHLAASTTTSISILLMPDSGDTSRFKVRARCDTGSGAAYIQSNGYYAFGSMYVIIIQYNAGTMSMYVNAVAATPYSTSGTPPSSIPNANRYWAIGGRITGNVSDKYKGKLLVWAIRYNRTNLTTDEITAIQNSGDLKVIDSYNWDHLHWMEYTAVRLDTGLSKDGVNNFIQTGADANPATTNFY